MKEEYFLDAVNKNLHVGAGSGNFRGIADAVHEAAIDKQNHRSGEAVAQSSDEPQSHEQYVDGVGVHENPLYTPTPLLLTIASLQNSTFLPHFFIFSESKQNHRRESSHNGAVGEVVAVTCVGPRKDLFI